MKAELVIRPWENRWSAVISLKDTALADRGDIRGMQGTGVGSPHVQGFGNSPTEAANDVLRQLGLVYLESIRP